MIGRRRILSTHTPAGRPTTMNGANSTAVSAPTWNGVARSTRIATRGMARRVICVPSWLIVSPAHRFMNRRFRHRLSAPGPRILMGPRYRRPATSRPGGAGLPYARSMPFEVIPAIDVSRGTLARLGSGRILPVAAFEGDPIAAAETFIEQGARWLHVVDLDLAL